MAISSTNSAGRESSVSLITTFVTMHTFAWITCSIIFVTVFLSSGKINRQSTWINLNLSWVIACFVYAFLLTTGQLFKPDPEPNVCIFQAAAVNAVPSLIAGAMLALTLQLWLNIVKNGTILARNRDTLLIIVPYVVPSLELIASLSYAIQHPEQVSLTESGMFCGLKNPIPGQFSAVFSGLLMLPTLYIEAVLSMYIYRHWYRFSNNNGNAVATIVRLVIFTVFGLIGVVVSIINLTSPANSAVANILESLPPLSFVLIFGFQGDILRVWMFWRPISDFGRRHDNNFAPNKWPQMGMQPESYSSDIELGQTVPLSATKPTWTETMSDL